MLLGRRYSVLFFCIYCYVQCFYKPIQLTKCCILAIPTPFVRKYVFIDNTLMHFLNVVQSYWRNPDLSNIALFGKDIRALLAISSQKIFFDDEHCGSYHYGPLETATRGGSYSSRTSLDLAVATPARHAAAGVSRQRRNDINHLIITDRIYEFNYLKTILDKMFDSVEGIQFKSDNEVVNLCLLSLMLDFGLFERYVGLLNLPFLHDLQHKSDTRELQVEVANKIYEFDRNNTSNAVTRSKVEELLFETSYKFLGKCRKLDFLHDT